jgi:DNA-binding transcriptional regulator YhcF (GntR family)
MDQISVDPTSSVPPFEQLRSQIAAAVTRGDLAPGTRLGTVRQTATDLGLAVNTVARAYRELEADGVVVTRGRQGTFVRSAVVDGGTSEGGEAAREAAADYVRAVRRVGLTRAEAVRLVEETWD